MSAQASVTLSLDEYNKLSDGASGGIVGVIALVAFAAGVVVGIVTVDKPDRPAPRQPVVTVSNATPISTH